jgi:hypothetical protein
MNRLSTFPTFEKFNRRKPKIKRRDKSNNKRAHRRRAGI